MLLQQTHAGGHQAACRVPLIAVHLRRGRSRWPAGFALGQPPGRVPAVVRALLLAGAAVAGFEQLACRIPAVGLQPLVEPFFLGEPVHHVPGKAALAACSR
jgi:hypothetical protein